MLQLKNLSKTYFTKKHKVHALKDVNLTFADKGMVFVIGKSGSGKSTLLNMISGFDKPTRGGGNTWQPRYYTIVKQAN